MTLAQTKTKTGRWSLAAALLAGAALCAPLSVADPAPQTEVKRVVIAQVGVDFDPETGARSYYRIEPDGTKTPIDEESFKGSLPGGIDAMIDAFPKGLAQDPALDGEPGLAALESKTVVGKVVFKMKDEVVIDPDAAPDMLANTKVVVGDNPDDPLFMTFQKLDIDSATVIQDGESHAAVAEALRKHFSDKQVAEMLREHLEGDTPSLGGDVPASATTVIRFTDTDKNVILTSKDNGETFTRENADGTTDTLNSDAVKAEHGFDVETMRKRMLKAKLSIPLPKESGAYAND